jgi:hypothetical protein
MSTDISIVIQGVDRFTPVFDQLSDAFGRVNAGGEEAAQSLNGVQEAVLGIANQSGQAQQALADFTLRAAADAATLVADQGQALQALAAQQEQTAAALNDRMLALQATGDVQRLGEEQRANEGIRQERQGHLARMVDLEQRNAQQLTLLDAATQNIRLSSFRTFLQSLETLAQSQGRAMAQTAKALAVAQALVDTYLAANAMLAQVPYPLNFLAAAAVTVQGLANVQRIQQVGIAHGGLESVPRDATFLLQQGERVLSPQQNRDLTQFLGTQPGVSAGGGMTVQNLTVHVLENATSAQALLSMSQADLRRVVTERVIPTLDELARLGIRPRFVESNT